MFLGGNTKVDTKAKVEPVRVPPAEPGVYQYLITAVPGRRIPLTQQATLSIQQTLLSIKGLCMSVLRLASLEAMNRLGGLITAAPTLAQVGR